MIDPADMNAQGERLLRRAADPGVIRRNLALRRSFEGGAWLAAEIFQRYAPADSSSAWGGGAGRWTLTPGPSPTRTPSLPGEGRVVTSPPKTLSSPPLSFSSGSAAKTFASSSLPSPGGPGVRAEGRGAPISITEAEPAIIRRATARPQPPGAPLSSPHRPAAAPAGEGTGVRLEPAIVHRAADRSTVQRTSLAPARSVHVSEPPLFLPAGEGLAPSPTPLREPVQVQRMVIPRSELAATELLLPLARTAQPAEVIHQQAAENNPGVITPQTASPADEEAAASGGATVAPGLDIEEVVDLVMRRLTRTLAVENERHGGRRWT